MAHTKYVESNINTSHRHLTLATIAYRHHIYMAKAHKFRSTVNTHNHTHKRYNFQVAKRNVYTSEYRAGCRHTLKSTARRKRATTRTEWCSHPNINLCISWPLFLDFTAAVAVDLLLLLFFYLFPFKWCKSCMTHTIRMLERKKTLVIHRIQC